MTLIAGGIGANPAPPVIGLGSGDETSAISYASTRGAVQLVVARRSVANLAGLAAYYRLSPTSVDGAPGWAIDSGSAAMTGLAWARDDLLLVLVAFGGGVDLDTLAPAVRPASESEWAQLLEETERAASEQPESPVLATMPGLGPEPTTSFPTPTTSAVAPIGDDTVAELQVETHTPNEIGVRPAAGAVAPLSVSVTADAVSVRSGYSGSGLTITELTPSAFTRTTADGGVLTLVATVDPAATALRVTAGDGRRTLVPLVAVAAYPEVRFAVWVATTGEQPPAELVDTAGTVLATAP